MVLVYVCSSSSTPPLADIRSAMQRRRVPHAWGRSSRAGFVAAVASVKTFVEGAVRVLSRPRSQSRNHFLRSSVLSPPSGARECRTWRRQSLLPRRVARPIVRSRPDQRPKPELVMP